MCQSWCVLIHVVYFGLCAMMLACVMVCTCWLVCHGVYLLACVSWCVLVGLCVMVCTCWLVCHGVNWLVSWCVCVLVCLLDDTLIWGMVSMALTQPVEGLEMYFPPPPSLGSILLKLQNLCNRNFVPYIAITALSTAFLLQRSAKPCS